MIELNALIKNRYSPLAFSPKPVEDDKLEAIFEAARWAASSYNEQPWRFVYSKREDEAKFNQLLNCLIEPNQTWAKNAGVLILVVAKKNFSHNDTPNAHATYDTGSAVTNICIQALDADLYVRQMAGYYADKVQEVYNLPDDHQCMAILALGYLGNTEDLPENLQNRAVAPRVRKDLDTIRHKDEWFE